MIEFRIGNCYWQLVVVNKDSINGDLGITYFSEYKIAIAMQRCKENMKNALTHEVAHAFRWSYGYIISDQNKINISALDLEEVIANFVETYGRDIIELVDSLWEEIEEEYEFKEEGEDE